MSRKPRPVKPQAESGETPCPRKRSANARRNAVNILQESYDLLDKIATRLELPKGALVDYLVQRHGRSITKSKVRALIPPKPHGRPRQSLAHRSQKIVPEARENGS